MIESNNQGSNIELSKVIEFMNEERCEAIFTNNSILHKNKNMIVFTKSLKIFIFESDLKSARYINNRDNNKLNELLSFIKQSKLSNIEILSNENVIIALKGKIYHIIFRS